MVKEPLLSVLTLGQTYDEFLLVVEPIVKGSESKEDFVNVMVKDFYTDDIMALWYSLSIRIIMVLVH